MGKTDLKHDFKLGDVILKNFIHLTDEERVTVRKWRNNENIRKWMYASHIISQEEHAGFLENLKKDNKNFYWAVRNKNNNEYSGVVYLNKVDFRNKNAYLGIYLNPDVKFPGFGRLLIECLKELAFNVVKLHTLKLEVMDANKKAVRFYEKSGFRKERKLRKFVARRNCALNVIVMGMPREEYHKLYADKNR